MRKSLRASLCVMMTMALLLPLGPPADMITDFYVTATSTAAKVGDTILFAASGFVGTGPYEFKDTFYRDDVPYAYSMYWVGSNSIYYAFHEPGTYRCKYTVRDISAGNELERWSPYVDVSYRNAPEGLAVTSLSWDSLSVVWNAVAGADGYELWRKGGSSVDFEIFGYFTEPNRIFRSLSPGTKYDFKVRCMNEVYGRLYPSSLFSAVKSGIPLRWVDMRQQPVVVNGTKLRISWVAVEGVSGYELWRATSLTGAYTRVYRGGMTQYTNTGLTPGTRYYYKARAWKAVTSKTYYGPWAQPIAAVPLDRPVITSAVATSSTRVLLTWEAVAGATGYKVFMSGTPAGDYAAVRTVNTTSLTVTGLSAWTPYYFKVQPYRRIYTSSYYGPMSGYKSARTAR